MFGPPFLLLIEESKDDYLLILIYYYKELIDKLFVVLNYEDEDTVWTNAYLKDSLGIKNCLKASFNL